VDSPADAHHHVRLTHSGSERSLLAVAAVLCAVVVAMSLTPDQTAGTRRYDAFAVAVLIAAYAPLWWARARPLASLVVVQLVTCAWFLRDYPGALVAPAVLAAIYFVTVTGDRRRGAIALVLVVAPTTLAAMLASTVDSLTSAAGIVGWMIAAALLGEAIHQRRSVEHELRHNARVAAAEQAAESERKITEERLRIARDMHDVLAHSVTAMSIQAAVAADSLDSDPDASRSALAVLRTQARDAVDEIRASIASLRNDTESGEVEPVPAISGIATLAAHAAVNGLAVTTELVDPGPVPDLVEVSAYRIVQEALTNIQRHSHAHTAQVSLATSGAELDITVTDPGPAKSPDAPPGFGLVGMQERADAVGGTVSRRRTSDGGFEVHAVLPIGHRNP
jgi:signal transduction histidine kinase